MTSSAIFEWTQYYIDPNAHIKEGHRMKINNEGVITVELQQESKQRINLNW
jgi:hypothetical protein